MKRGLQTVGGLSFFLLWGLAGASDQGAPLAQVVTVGGILLLVAVGSFWLAGRCSRRPRRRATCLTFLKKSNNASLGA